MSDLATIATALTTAGEQLASDNRRAGRIASERFLETLKGFVTDEAGPSSRYGSSGGIVNAIGVLATIVDELAAAQPEDSQSEDDYLFASSLLHALMVGLDLPYGERSGQSRRKTAMADRETNFMVVSQAKGRAAKYKAELEKRFLDAGRAGANADTKHPLRQDWEFARDIVTN